MTGIRSKQMDKKLNTHMGMFYKGRPRDGNKY